LNFWIEPPRAGHTDRELFPRHTLGEGSMHPTPFPLVHPTCMNLKRIKEFKDKLMK